LFWVVLRKVWSGWKRPLILVTPETVVRWHRTGFRLYWSRISRTRKVVGRKPISGEVRDLIFRMVAENPTWGRLASTGSCSNWVSKSRNEPFLAGSNVQARILIQPGAG
jgi:hypothetical protein